MALESRRLLASPYEVTTTLDSTVNGSGSLREAILLANTNASNTTGVLDVTITFDPTLFSTPQTIPLTNGALLVNAPNLNLTIAAPVPGDLTIQGNGTDRLFDVLGGASISLSGLTLAGGSTTTVGGALEVLSKSSATLSDCTISGNSAKDGGGIYNNGILKMSGCTIEGNSAKYGGGIWGNSKTTLIDSTISGNSAVEGGGLLNYHPGHAYLTNDTIAKNRANYGGGLSNYGRAYLTAATITGNTVTGTNTTSYSKLGGGIYNYEGTYYGALAKLYDVIVAENRGPRYSYSDVGGNNANSVIGSNNLIGAGGSGGMFPGTSGNITQTDPAKLALGTLGDYGGPTPTVPLLSGSVAIGAGAAESGVTTDQRGLALGSSVDIGAYQAVAVPLVVGASGDGGTGASLGTIDLRGAIDLAELGTSASTITFDPTAFKTPETINLTEGPLSLTGTLTIDGPAAGVTVSGGRTGRDFQVGSGASATISGLTIANGSATSGGGLYNLGSAKLQNCAIVGNSAKVNGGGVVNLGTLDLIQCTMGNNVAGGLGGGIYSLGTASMVASTISGNTATGSGGGGGIYQAGASTAGATLGDTIVAGNAGAGGTPSDIAGPGAARVVGTYNLVGPGGSGGIGGGTGDQILTQTTGLLGNLGNYGAGTLTFPLLPGSPAIDAGSSALLPSGTNTDQRAQPRIVGSSVDIGAFESQGFTMTPAAGSTPQAAMPGASFGASLLVTVAADHAGDPVAGGVVGFAVTSSGGASASLSSSTSTISAGGTASVSATANGQYGSYVATASALGAGTASFDLTNLVPVSFSGLSNPSIVFGTASATISGTLADGKEIPSGQTVVLTFQGTTENATVQSNGSFQATFTNTSGLNVPGSPYTVDLSYASDGTYGPATATATLTVTQATPTVVVTDAGGTYKGSAFPGSATVAGLGGQTSSTLEGTGLTLSYYVGRTATGTASSSAPITAGTYTVQAQFAGSQDYVATSATATFTIAQATPTLTWPAPASIVYGTALSATQLDPTANVGGTFAYSPASGTLLAAGTHTLTTTFTPTDTTDYTTATASVSLVVNQATPTITWPTPTAITYGTALSATQLDPTSSVGGTFVYSPASGTILGAGTSTLTATFTPTDTTDYKTATATVSLVVNQATPTITWPAPASIVYGTALSATQLDPTANVGGTFAYSPASGTILGAGTSTLTATFTPTDTTDYKTATASVSLVVTKATPTITWPTPTAITYGTALSATQLDPTASVGGTFVYSPASGTILGAGTSTLTATFTPTDTTDYKNATATVSLVVNQATPTITWPAPAAITYGTVLSATQLDPTASVAGTFSESPAAGTLLGAGMQTLSATFTPTDSQDEKTVTTTTTIVVTPATPAVSVTAGGTYDGQPIPATATVSGIDGNPSASLEGVAPVLAYSTSAGSPLSGPPTSAGNYSVVATFPGSADYAKAAAQADFTIGQATPSIVWPSPLAILAGTALSTTQLDASSTVPGTLTYNPPLGTILPTGSQSLSVTLTPADATDYTTATATVSLVVRQPSRLTWGPLSPIVYGTALSTAQLDATGNVPGTIVYSPTIGTVLHAGSQTLSATLTPSDLTNYAPVTATLTLVVQPATPSITWPTPTAITYGTALGSAQLDATGSVPGTIVYKPAAGTVLHAGTQTLSATFTPTDATDYADVVATATLVVEKATPVVSWSPPSSIVYGTAIGPAQRDATANVPGTFAYSVAAGTVPGVGTQRFSLTFTPADTADETTVGTSATIVVQPALPTLVVHAGGGTYNGSPFTAVATLLGVKGAAGAALEGVAPTLTYLANGSPLNGPPTAAGTYTAIATFPGSADYAATTATPVAFTIAPATSSVTLSLSIASAVFGQSVVLTAAVAAPGAPTGSITFVDGGTPLGTVAVDPSGHASLAVDVLNLGPHAIAALYSGDANRSGSPSTPVSISVQPAATQIVLVPHPVFRRRKLVGLSLTAVVQPIAPGSGIPTGSVSLFLQINRKKQKTLAILGLGGGQATLSIKPHTVLNKALSLSYAGSPGFLPTQLAATRLNPHALAALERIAARPSHAKMIPAGPIRHRLTLRSR